MNLITSIVKSLDIDKLHCSICRHYLSVKPVLINIQNGANICGRCSTSSTLFYHNRSFELLASQFTFPCMYADKGCSVKRLFQYMGTHEKYCFFRIVTCYCSWSGNLIAFKIHYETQHKDLIIYNDVPITIRDEFTQFLFVYKNLHFFITCKNNSNNISLKIVGLTNVDNKCNPVFICNLYESNIDFKIELGQIEELPPTQKVATFTLKSEISSKINENILKQIICPNCSIQMTPPILKCPKGHLTCVECTGLSLNYCTRCNDDFSTFTCNAEIECMAGISTFTCRWSCGQNFNAFRIRDHEQGCEKRLYQCWHEWDCDWGGYLSEVASHDMTCCSPSPDTNQCILMFNIQEVTFLRNKTNYLEIHVLTYNCRFDVTFDFINSNTAVCITINDFYGLGLFEFEAYLIHTENRNCSFNKVYRLPHRSAGCYSFDLPIDDVLQFGENKSFKITVRIICLNEKERKVKQDCIYGTFKNYKSLLI